ncbi:MAG TPA: branched-chain amino acid ABC transporter permease [Aggregatilineales bacterium]|nr:branched-chain amino acid ABC transporter permease [Aggregatilineales bacterium]
MQDGRVTVGRTLRTNWFLGVLVAFLIALPFIVAELTGSSPYGIERGSRIIMRGESAFWMALLIEVFALTVFVMSYNLMFGFTGVISFGHALFFGLGGYTLGMLLQYTALDPNLALVLAVLLTLVLTGLSALLIGLATLRLRGVYFAIFTLAVAEMVWIFVGRWAVTNGEDGFAIDRLPAWIDPSSNRLTLYYIGLFLFVFTFLFIRRIVNSPTGSVFQAIRENEDRARAIGYHTLRYKLVAIIIAGMMAGGAGMLHGILNKKIGPEMFSVSYTVDALLMTIIGGVGTFTGPVIGAAGLHLTETLTRDIVIPLGFTSLRVGDSWLLIQGLIFVIVVMVFPFGLVGTWNRLRMRFRRRPAQAATKSSGKNVKSAG